jgi:feruloyl-CoA synthase
MRLNDASSRAVYRPIHLGKPGLAIERKPNGLVYAQNPNPLRSYPPRLSDRLDFWARVAPERIFLAQRISDRSWRTITYSAFQRSVRSIGQALLNRRLSVDRPVVVLSGNDIEHALLMHAAMYVGIPYVPVSPSYSLAVSEFTRLSEILWVLKPGLIFAEDLSAYVRALKNVGYTSAEAVTCSSASALQATSFSELANTPATSAVNEANARVGHSTIAKILFTSGSTGHPKGVINTQEMLCSNQAMILSMLPFLEDDAPITVDWLPWHHTFGGNHNLGVILYNGGSLYIDEGRPISGAFAATARNLREIATTLYFNVPKGYEELIMCLRQDSRLRETFFSRLKLIFYAAASLPQTVWDELEQLALETCGERITIVSSFGSTETAPFAMCPVKQSRRAGYVGLPAPGVKLKLVPIGEKLEARIKGPNVTPGYWKNEELTRAAFDDEGFYCMRDALAFLEPQHPEEGFIFDGRVAEDFKLSTGTWVNVGLLRTSFLHHCNPYVQDVAIAGHDRDYISALIFPNVEACRAINSLAPDASLGEIATNPAIRELFHQLLMSFAAENIGSSSRIARAMLMPDRPSLDKGELTDKGSLNQLVTLRNRSPLVDELYATPISERVIAIHTDQQDQSN